ncbi:MAG: PEP-CTERM sorting domain-containing protein [bacterium]|nr:PEP-CTERM sorting domain-containing protein [bacterium]
MQRLFSSLACVPFAIAALISAPASAAIVAEIDGLTDVDPMTPGIQLNPGTYNATIRILFNSSDGNLPGNVNTIGLDLSWVASSGITVTPQADMGRFFQAGPVASNSGFVLDSADLQSGAFNVNGGTFLNSLGLAAPTGADGNLGGAGYADPAGAQWNGQMNSGTSATRLLMTANFEITGAETGVFETLTFTPSGVLTPGTGSTTGGGVFAVDGAPFQMGNNNVGGPTYPQGFTAVGVSFVPEPGSAAGLLALAGCVAWRSRRRSV